MNQAFFTLSLGIGSMAIFGSYVGRDRTLLGESATVACLDTFVAIVAGLIIFPACSSYGVEVGAGPALLFNTMATVFNNMVGRPGRRRRSSRARASSSRRSRRSSTRCRAAGSGVRSSSSS